jgi:phosphoesterase RecJ-like protein
LAVTAEGTASIEEVAEALRRARRITAICHESPDADTIGAAIAVSIIAERLGAESEIVSADAVPPAFAFLPRIDRIHPRPLLEPDLAVVCDAANLERVGGLAREEANWFSRARLLNIDHHLSSNYFGDLNLVDPTASATCEVIARVVAALDIHLDAELSTALLTGIVRDSHGFSDESTSSETLRTTASLVDGGAPLAIIYRHLLSDLPYRTMGLWGKMLATLGQAMGGRIVYAILTQEMLDETGTQQPDADGLVEFLASAQGSDVTLLLRELGPSLTRISIRTSPAVDATQVAGRFGGGGHARRAGCRLNMPLADGLASLLLACQEVIGLTVANDG